MHIKSLLLSLSFLIITGCNVSLPDSKIASLESEIQKLRDRDDSDQRLGQYTINMMYETSAKAKLSDGRKQILARSIVRVANEVFETEEHKKAFIAVIAIESGFQKYAQSPTGPRGLSQVAKKAFHEGLLACGVDNIVDEDVWDTDINLYAGACYFRSILEKHNDPLVAIVAYNQGPNSESIKTFSKSGSIQNIEALKYIAKFAFLKKVTDVQQPNTPIATELPKMSPKTSTEETSKPKKVVKEPEDKDPETQVNEPSETK
jgi:hypothetical protein